jgi:hypothetical protein
MVPVPLLQILAQNHILSLLDAHPIAESKNRKGYVFGNHHGKEFKKTFRIKIFCGLSQVQQI